MEAWKMLNLFSDPEVVKRIHELDLRFNAYGVDRFGVSQKHLIHFFSLLAWFYRNYFTVTVHDIEKVPATGRAMLVGNHSGGLPVDGGMVLVSMILEKNPPRLVHGMVEKFAQTLPLVSTWFSRVGQFTGLPEHALSLLEDERVLMIFPEGAKGTGKLYKDRYRLVDFGTGFMRLALKTGSPVVPFAFVGGEEALASHTHFDFMARLVGTPYWPVPSYLIPLPLPIACDIHYGDPMHLSGDGTEADEVVLQHVEEVKERISRLIEQGRAIRHRRLGRTDEGDTGLSKEKRKGVER